MTKSNYFKEEIWINPNFVYHACGEHVTTIECKNEVDAWEWVNTHYGYDSVVYMIAK